MWAAHDGFWRHTGLPPPLILRLASAHHQQLAALGRVPRLLRMLTAGFWALGLPRAQPQPAGQAARPQDPRQRQQQHGRLPAAPAAQPDSQQAQQAQQEALASCRAQLALAGELLALYGGGATAPPAAGASRPGSGGGLLGRGMSPGPAAAAAAPPASSGVQQWVAEMEKAHGPQHWLLAALRRLAGEAAAARAPPRAAAGGRSGAAALHAGAQQLSPGPSRAELAVDLGQWMALASGRPAAEPTSQSAPLADARASELNRAASELASLQLAPAGGGSGGGEARLAAWQAAEKLADWVAAAPSSAGAGGVSSAQLLQERAASAVAAVFRSHASAAEPAGLECLLRLGELLGRRCK